MKVVYFGTGTFAVPPLAAIAEHVCLVVTQPDRPGQRGHKLVSTPVKEFALANGLEVATPEKARAPEFVESVRSLEADALVVASYGQILSLKLLNSARIGGINLHGSLLPAYRGAAPIQRCLENGDEETGVTLMQMDKGMDTGDMIAVERLAIDPEETYGELQDRLAVLSAEMIRAWLPRLVTGDYPRTPQNHDFATHAAKVDRSETELSFSRPAGQEFNRYRAFSPNPSVFISTRFGRLKLLKAALEPCAAAEPGTVLALDPLTVAFTDGALRFLDIQPEGKKKVSGRDFANGARLRVGDCLL